QAGMYTVRYNAATQIGICVPSLAVVLAARQLSNPMDPLAVDPTLSGTGIGSTGISVGSSTGGSVGTLPLISPYSNPIVGSSTNSTTTSTTNSTTTTTTSTTNTIASTTSGLLC